MPWSSTSRLQNWETTHFWCLLSAPFAAAAPEPNRDVCISHFEKQSQGGWVLMQQCERKSPTCVGAWSSVTWRVSPSKVRPESPWAQERHARLTPAKTLFCPSSHLTSACWHRRKQMSEREQKCLSCSWTFLCTFGYFAFPKEETENFSLCLQSLCSKYRELYSRLHLSSIIYSSSFGQTAVVQNTQNSWCLLEH